MKNSCFEIILSEQFGPISSRDSGAELRKEIEFLVASAKTQTIIVDFQGRSVTPSFADECFGILAERWGLETFKKRVTSRNVNPKSRVLLGHVIRNRVNSENHQHSTAA